MRINIPNLAYDHLRDNLYISGSLCPWASLSGFFLCVLFFVWEIHKLKEQTILLKLTAEHSKDSRFTIHRTEATKKTCAVYLSSKFNKHCKTVALYLHLVKGNWIEYLHVILVLLHEFSSVHQVSFLLLYIHRKVLLRERKRHTARCVAVASACYFGVGGVTPGTPPDMGWGTPPESGYPPIQGWGTPPDMGWGTPPSKVGVPPHPRLDWVPPHPRLGYPPRHGMGTPPDMGGYPPSKVGVPPCPRLDRVPPLSKAGSGTPPPPSVDRLKI